MHESVRSRRHPALQLRAGAASPAAKPSHYSFPLFRLSYVALHFTLAWTKPPLVEGVVNGVHGAGVSASVSLCVTALLTDITMAELSICRQMAWYAHVQAGHRRAMAGRRVPRLHGCSSARPANRLFWWRSGWHRR